MLTVELCFTLQILQHSVVFTNGVSGKVMQIARGFVIYISSDDWQTSSSKDAFIHLLLFVVGSSWRLGKVIVM